MNTRTFQMQNRLDGIDPLVMSLKTAVEGALGHEALARFEICTTEVLSNIVKHACADDKGTPITVTLAEGPSALLVEVFDPVGAACFDPRDHMQDPKNRDPLAESGRGIGLILQCADGVTYGPSKGRKRIALQFSKR